MTTYNACYGLFAVLLAAIAAAEAGTYSSDALPADLLDACDAAAPIYGAYDSQIAEGAATLTRLGVFSEREFSGVRIGFCDLAGAGGPVATTSCTRDTILMDDKYRASDQSLTLAATLAHEMKHQLQHQERKSRFGADYCASEQYQTDKPQLEDAADRFGDAVAALLYVGRPIIMRNACANAVSVFLEPDEPLGGASGSERVTIAPMSAYTASIRTTAATFYFYARSAPGDGRQWIWRGHGNKNLRRLDGKTVSLRRSTFSNSSREDGAFEVLFTCPEA